MLDTLRARGVADAQLARVRAPAGERRAGAQEEIALHALAEVVALRHDRITANPVAPPAALAGFAVDPVCGMTVDTSDAAHTASARRTDVLLLLRRLPGAVRRRPGTVPPHHRRLSVAASSRRGSSSRRGRRDGWASRSNCSRLHGRPLLEAALAAACDSRLDEVVVVLGAHADEIRRSVRLGRARVVVNPDYVQGMSTSLAGRDRSLEPRIRRAVVILGDQPDISAEVVEPPPRGPGGVRAACGRAELRRAAPPAGRARPRALGRASTRSRATSGVGRWSVRIPSSLPPSRPTARAAIRSISTRARTSSSWPLTPPDALLASARPVRDPGGSVRCQHSSSSPSGSSTAPGATRSSVPPSSSRTGGSRRAGARSSLTIPADAEVLEDDDLTLLPGFMDMHVHLASTGTNLVRILMTPPSLALLNSVPNCARTLAAGVTTVRDAGHTPVGVRLAAEAGYFPGAAHGAGGQPAEPDRRSRR